MKKTIFLIFISTCVSQLFAQQNCKFRVSGNIVSSEDLQPVQGAEIFIENGHYKTLSDEKGLFELVNLCPGEQLIEVDAPGFKHSHFTVFLNKDTALTLSLMRESRWLDSLQIQTAANKDRGLSDADFVRNLGKDLARNLMSIPGIAVLQTGNNVAKPVLQGFTGLRLPIFINGIRQEGQQWGNEHGPEIGLMGYESVAILKGSATLEKTHDAIAGLIAIDNKGNPHPGEFNLESGLAFNSNGRQFTAFSKAFSKPFGRKFSWFANASSRIGGNYRAPDYFLSNTGLTEFTLNAGLVWDANPKWQKKTLSASYFRNNSGIFRGSKIGNISDLQQAMLRTQPLEVSDFSYAIGSPRQSVAHAGLAFSLESARKHNQRLNFGWQYDNRREFDLHRNSKTNFPQLDLYLLSLYGDYSQKLRIRSVHNYLKIGTAFQVYHNRYGGYFFIPDYNAWTQGIFASRHLQRNHWTHNLALRIDGKFMASSWKSNGLYQQDIRKFFNYAATFSTTYRKSLSLHLMRLWRAPWVNELYSNGVHHGSAAFEKGDPQLKIETNYKAELVYEKTTGPMGIYLGIFSNYMPGFINLSPDSTPVLTVRGAFPSFHYTQFLAWYTGADLRLDLKILPSLSTRTQISYIYARDLSHHTFPAYIPPATISQNLSLTTKKWTFTLACAYFFRQSYYTAGTDYLAPPPAYSLWNLSVELKKLFRKQNYRLYFNIDNLLNVSYRNYLDRFRYYADMPGRNISIKIVQNLHHHNEK